MAQGKSALGIVRKYHPNVAKIIEAKKDLHIEVTAQDCKAGRKKNAGSCAMARACEREYDGAIISLTTAYIIKGDTAIRYHVPQAISREIVSFDRAKQFAPGDYKLKAPSASFKLRPRGDRPLNPDRHKVLHSKNKIRNHKTQGIRAL
jgi:hypothetical protein